MWWWSLITKLGKKYLLGPFEDDVEARNKAEKFGGPFSLHELPTRDENKATRMIKAKYLNTEKIGHG